MCTELAHYALPMSFDGTLGNSQSERSLLVHLSAYYEIEDLTFPGAEGFQQPACIPQPLLPRALSLVPSDRASDSIDQRMRGHGLREEILGAGFDGANRRRDIPVSRKEDDRKRGAEIEQYPLEIG